MTAARAMIARVAARADLHEPVDLAAAALHVGRSARALRDWMRDTRLPLIPRACDVQTRRLLFELEDVEKIDRKRRRYPTNRRSKRDAA